MFACMGVCLGSKPPLLHPLRPPTIMFAPWSLLLFSLSLLPLSGESRYKRQMDSVEPPHPPLSAAQPPEVFKNHKKALTTQQTKSVHCTCACFLSVEERVCQICVLPGCFFAACADILCTQLVRFWIMAFIGQHLVFSPFVPWLQFYHGNPACIVMSLCNWWLVAIGKLWAAARPYRVLYPLRWAWLRLWGSSLFVTLRHSSPLFIEN